MQGLWLCDEKPYLLEISRSDNPHSFPFYDQRINIFLKQRLNQRIICFLHAFLQAFSKSIALAIVTPHAGINDLMSTLV